MIVDPAFNLSFDIDITINGKVYAVSLRYPAQYPATPPSIFPRDKTALWSNHQYGAGRELCLEYGPDTWTPDLTGADVVRSAYRLLAGENPSPDTKGRVPSRHAVSLGQQLRSATWRLVSTAELETTLASLPVGQVFTGKLSGTVRRYDNHYVISSISLNHSNAWQDSSLPSALTIELSDYALSIIRIAENEKLPSIDRDAFQTKCKELGVPDDALFIALVQGPSVNVYLDLKDKGPITRFSTIPAQADRRRMSESHDLLTSKTVGIVGCGSIGSKIGVSLARSGVSKFVLLDDDILFSHNLVRNDLDWREVGSHKTNALARRMQLVNRNVTVRGRDLQLAGQESASFASSALNLLSECDLIIDATANPEAFNLISAVAVSAKKAVLWAEVFAGGSGGLIARSRPGFDPSPQYARRSIENWFEQCGAEPQSPAIDYGLETDRGPMIADDADVSAIAAHATRLAIDTLLERQPSMFPCSAYAIGLAEDDFFSQPFDVRPIELGEVLEPEKPTLLPEDARQQVADVFAALVKE